MVPGHALGYLADQARAPYGERSDDEVLRYTSAAVAHLTAEPTAAVVIACNTASSVALETVRERFGGVAVVGMEPAVKPAAAATRSGVVGVLATTKTAEGDRLARLIAVHADGVEVVTRACPGLVEMVEDGLLDGPATRAAIERYVGPLIDRGADTLVLGCTHFSFLREIISRTAGPGVTVIDPAEAVARRTASLVGRAQGPRSVRYETTGDPVRFRHQLHELLGIDAPTHEAVLSLPAAP